MLVSWVIKSIRGLLGKEKPEEPTVCGHGPEPTVDCPECGAERRRATKYRWTIFAGLLLPCAIQSLDTTMCAYSTPEERKDMPNGGMGLQNSNSPANDSNRIRQVDVPSRLEPNH